MSRRVTVNLPDEIARRLDQESNVSQFVTTAIRDKMQHEERLAATQRMLAEAGYTPTADGLATMRDRLANVARRRANRQGG
jgi:metal-responsive CopG/Arc/MetJ family transcriptional regulator